MRLEGGAAAALHLRASQRVGRYLARPLFVLFSKEGATRSREWAVAQLALHRAANFRQPSLAFERCRGDSLTAEGIRSIFFDRVHDFRALRPDSLTHRRIVRDLFEADAVPVVGLRAVDRLAIL